MGEEEWGDERGAGRSGGTMSGAALGLRSTGSYGSLQQPYLQSGAAVFPIQSTPGGGRKGQKMFVSGSKEKERFLSRICKTCLPIRVGMFLVAVASLGLLMIVMTGFGRGSDLWHPPASCLFCDSSDRRALLFVCVHFLF